MKDLQKNVSNYEELIEALKHFRLLKGFRQMDLSLESGVARANISAFEQKRFSSISSETLFKLLDALDVNIYLSFVGEPGKPLPKGRGKSKRRK